MGRLSQTMSRLRAYLWQHMGAHVRPCNFGSAEAVSAAFRTHSSAGLALRSSWVCCMWPGPGSGRRQLATLCRRGPTLLLGTRLGRTQSSLRLPTPITDRGTWQGESDAIHGVSPVPTAIHTAAISKTVSSVGVTIDRDRPHARLGVYSYTLTSPCRHGHSSTQQRKSEVRICYSQQTRTLTPRIRYPDINLNHRTKILHLLYSVRGHAPRRV